MSTTTDEPTRCEWAGSDPAMVAYHDTEWGVPVHDDPTHFEFLVLEGAQAGLSWSTILKRRAGYRKAFAGFDARQGGALHARPGSRSCCGDPGIIRNRAKVEATVRNARAFLEVQEEFGSFDAYIWGFVGGRPLVNKWRRMAQLPADTAESEAVSSRPAAARLRVRRADRSATPTCRRPGWSTTTWSAASATRSSQAAAHQDAGAEAGHDRLLGGRPLGGEPSRRPGPISTKPSEA